MIDRDCLKAGGEAVGVPVDADLAERLDTYARLLVEWNEKMNLTAITEPGAMVVKHFVDSLAAAPLLPAGPLRLIDVGRGQVSLVFLWPFIAGTFSSLCWTA